jgi:hypothetical protein
LRRPAPASLPASPIPTALAAALLALATALPVLACATTTQRRSPHPALAKVWRDFVALPEERALAIAGDPLGEIWVTGAAGGQVSRELALDAALGECGRRRARHRMQAACVPYAVGEEIVWAGPE